MEDQNQQYPIVAVLGATGKVGSQLIRQLSEKGIPARALSRDSSRFINLKGITWTKGDIDDDSVMEQFLAGAEKLFLNTGVTEKMVEQQYKVIDMAKSASIKHIVKLSTPAARKPSKDRVGEWHWDIQEYLKSSGVVWNCLQPQSFMQNWLNDLASTIKQERKIYAAAGDGRRAFIDARDIAKVATCLFIDGSEWLNQIIPLSGGALVSFGDIAAAFSQALNEKVTYVSQSPEEAAIRMRAQRVPEFLINITLTIEANQKLGIAETLLTDNVRKITGEAPYSVYQFAKDYITYFR